jgi:hypothetical protein
VKDKPSQFDPRKTSEVIKVFHEGLTKLGPEFVQAIMQDMEAIGYKLEDVGVKAPPSLSVTFEPIPPSGELVGSETYSAAHTTCAWI